VIRTNITIAIRQARCVTTYFVCEIVVHGSYLTSESYAFSPPIDSICAIMIVWKLGGKIITELFSV